MKKFDVLICAFCGFIFITSLITMMSPSGYTYRGMYTEVGALLAGILFVISLRKSLGE